MSDNNIMQLRKDEVISKIDALEDLPTLPAVVTKVMQLAHDDDVSIKDIKQVVITDPPLCAKLIKVANSAIYARRVPAKSIEDAVFSLGLDGMVSVCASMSVISTFDSWETQQLNRQGIWKHSLSTGFLAKSLELRKDMHRSNSPDLFLAGLVHHIGWIVMDQYFSDELDKIIDLAIEKPIWDVRYEEEIIGMNHAELGAIFLEKWGMPESIVNVVRYHHDFDLYDDHPGHAALINLSAYLAPYKFKLEPRLDKLSDHIPNMVRDLEGPKLIAEMEMRYNTSIKQSTFMTDRMMSWM